MSRASAATGLFGGAFDPPHEGHVAVARGALRQLELETLHVLVSDRPGHRSVTTSAAVRLRLAQVAFAELERTRVEVDPFARTIDLLRARIELRDPVVIVGADQLVDFARWKEPGEVLRLARLAVAARPGIDDEAAAAALRALPDQTRVVRFVVDPVPVSSTEVRARAARGEPIDGFVPPRVAELVRELGLYGPGHDSRRATGLH